MNQEIRAAMEDSPVIAAVKNDAGLERCLGAESRIVFILYGSIITIPDIVSRVRSAGKFAIVHVDLIQGLRSHEIAVDFIKKETDADGIISTRGELVSRAKALHLFTVMRFFLIDSMAYQNMSRQIGSVHPDVIEILPALMPKIVRRVVSEVHRPVIAGGLVSDREDVLSVLDAGASCVSTTNQDVWFL